MPRAGRRDEVLRRCDFFEAACDPQDDTIGEARFTRLRQAVPSKKAMAPLIASNWRTARSLV